MPANPRSRRRPARAAMSASPRASGFATACRGKNTAPGNRRETGPDPVDLVIASNKGRIAELVPIRYGRMSVSPFTFYRGTALNMASDLAATPNTGVHTHLCGDCHLMNFGGFATPERRIDLRHQRFRRDVARAVGMGPEAARGELRARGPVERLCRRRPAERRDGVRALVSRADQGLREDGRPRRVVRAHRQEGSPRLAVRRRHGSATAQAHRQGSRPTR